MTEDRWEWALLGRRRVAAMRDRATGTEIVMLDAHVMSRGAKGSATTHAFELASEGDDARRVTVSFDPERPICVLRLDGDEVAPEIWPDRRRERALAASPLPARRESGPSAIPKILGLVAGLAIVTVAIGMLRRSDKPSAAAAALGVHRAENGLFVAHFPQSFVARRPTTASDVGGVVLEDASRRETIVLVAKDLEGTTREPWALHQRLRDEALTAVPRADGFFEETSRRDDTCAGERGAVVVGRIHDPHGEKAWLWTCAFVSRDAGYVALYVAPGGATAADFDRLRKIVDATELSRLAATTP